MISTTKTTICNFLDLKNENFGKKYPYKQFLGNFEQFCQILQAIFDKQCSPGLEGLKQLQLSNAGCLRPSLAIRISNPGWARRVRLLIGDAYL